MDFRSLRVHWRLWLHFLRLSIIMPGSHNRAYVPSLRFQWAFGLALL
jgi:hypothetical protein